MSLIQGRNVWPFTDTIHVVSADPLRTPSLTNEFPFIWSEPSEPCHKKPCYRLIFKLGPCHSPSQQCTVAGFLASRICYYGSSVCFLSELFSLYITVCTIRPFPLSLSLFRSPCICWLGYWRGRSLPCKDFSRFFSSFSFLCLFSALSLSISFSFSLSVYFLQCDQVQVIPIPSVCIIIFHFSSSHSFTVTSSLCSLRFIILAACGYWHKGDFSLLSGEILHGPILIIIRLSRHCFHYLPSSHTVGSKKLIQINLLSYDLFVALSSCPFLQSLEQHKWLIFLLDQIYWILHQTFAAAVWISKWMTGP